MSGDLQGLPTGKPGGDGTRFAPDALAKEALAAYDPVQRGLVLALRGCNGPQSSLNIDEVLSHRAKLGDEGLARTMVLMCRQADSGLTAFGRLLMCEDADSRKAIGENVLPIALRDKEFPHGQSDWPAKFAPKGAELAGGYLLSWIKRQEAIETFPRTFNAVIAHLADSVDTPRLVDSYNLPELEKAWITQQREKRQNLAVLIARIPDVKPDNADKLLASIVSAPEQLPQIDRITGVDHEGVISKLLEHVQSTKPQLARNALEIALRIGVAVERIEPVARTAPYSEIRLRAAIAFGVKDDSLKLAKQIVHDSLLVLEGGRARESLMAKSRIGNQLRDAAPADIGKLFTAALEAVSLRPTEVRNPLNDEKLLSHLQSVKDAAIIVKICESWPAVERVGALAGVARAAFRGRWTASDVGSIAIAEKKIDQILAEAAKKSGEVLIPRICELLAGAEEDVMTGRMLCYDKYEPTQRAALLGAAQRTNLSGEARIQAIRSLGRLDHEEARVIEQSAKGDSAILLAVASRRGPQESPTSAESGWAAKALRRGVEAWRRLWGGGA